METAQAQSQADLDMQKLAIEFENHAEQDDRNFGAIQAFLEKIDSKIDKITNGNVELATKVAILETNMVNNQKLYRNEKKAFYAGVFAITIVLNLISYFIQT